MDDINKAFDFLKSFECLKKDKKLINFYKSWNICQFSQSSFCRRREKIMKTFESFILLSAMLMVPANAVETIHINCTFRALSQQRYQCELTRVLLTDDDENKNIVIGGQHLEGRSNEDVNQVSGFIVNSPFFISQVFTTFPNILEVSFMDIGLRRIQPGAFANSTNLRFVDLRFNSDFTTIHANAFTGASSLWYLNLSPNGIETIHERAFEGLTSLAELYLDRNRIVHLPAHLFRTATLLRYVTFESNQIKNLDGRLFSSSPNIIELIFFDNQINSIGRRFMDRFLGLRGFDMRENKCVNRFFFNLSPEAIRPFLSNCFENYDKENGIRNFSVEVRGTVTIRDDYENEIIRI